MKILKNKIVCLAFIISTLFITVPANPALAANCSDSSPAGLQDCLSHNKIITDLNDIIAFLSAGVGIVVVGMIILGGIQYSMAGDNADAVKKARQKIVNGFSALLLFLLIFAFLQWIVPGGVF